MSALDTILGNASVRREVISRIVGIAVAAMLERGYIDSSAAVHVDKIIRDVGNLFPVKK